MDTQAAALMQAQTGMSASNYPGIAQQLGVAQQIGLAGVKVEPIVTLNQVSEQNSVASKHIREVERQLAGIMEHISGRPASYGLPCDPSPEKAPSGIIGRMRDEASDNAATASRALGLLHNIMTHLGMNEPASIARNQG